ncbi:MAG TPA: TraB/GumN family protein, partial [Pseudomonadales bacterium]|nr:TraB/GumN family protein [Pseudomonadales bacterium]
LMQAYLQGNLDKILQISDQLSAEEKNQHLQALMDRLVQKRNHLMFERMQTYLKKGGAMVAVGALHLAGNEGLLNLLHQQGWRITPIPLQWQ